MRFSFHRKKKNTLLYQTSAHVALAHRSRRPGVHFSFLNIFSAWKLGGMVFFVLLAGGALAYGLFFSTEFQIKSVSVQGASSGDTAAITAAVQHVMQEKILHLIPRTSYFLFPEAEMLSSLKTEFPRLSSITISHPNPTAVSIAVAERNIVGIWCPGAAVQTTDVLSSNTQPSGITPASQPTLRVVATQGQCAFFDENGVIFEPAPDATSGHLLFVVHDAERQDEPLLGTQVLNAAAYKFLQNLRVALSNAGRIPVFFTIKSDQEIDANFLDGTHAWNVYFSPTYGAQYQVDVLTELLAQTIGPKSFPYLDYVDLRLENKAYYFVHPAG